MSDAALGILKGCLIALLYLFLLRVVLLVASELRGTPGLGRPAAPAGGVPVEPGIASAPPPPKRRRRRGAARGTWHLTVTEPASGRGTTFAVDDELTIGRGGGCGIALPSDTYVSTVHARAFSIDDELWIEDLGSTNGTLLNDAPLEQAVRLERGDKVRVGSTVLEVTRS